MLIVNATSSTKQTRLGVQGTLYLEQNGRSQNTNELSSPWLVPTKPDTNELIWNVGFPSPAGFLIEPTSCVHVVEANFRCWTLSSTNSEVWRQACILDTNSTAADLKELQFNWTILSSHTAAITTAVCLTHAARHGPRLKNGHLWFNLVTLIICPKSLFPVMSLDPRLAVMNEL